MKKLFKIYLGIKLNSSDLIFIGYYLKSHKRILFRRILIARFKHISNKYNIEIPLSFNNIGENLLLAHANNITVNSRAKIGDNCILFKGCTIGSIRSGKREGVPIIGNNVVIGINAFCGGGLLLGTTCL